jgi:hypothetical protein
MYTDFRYGVFSNQHVIARCAKRAVPAKLRRELDCFVVRPGRTPRNDRFENTPWLAVETQSVFVTYCVTNRGARERRLAEAFSRGSEFGARSPIACSPKSAARDRPPSYGAGDSAMDMLKSAMASLR